MTSTAPPSAPARPRQPIDPRFRQRRIEVRRDEGRRRLRLLLAAAAVPLTILLGWAVTRSPVLAVHHVRVDGSPHTPVPTIVAASGIRSGQAMVDLDAGAAVRRLDRLPWVARARVSRSWPGTVRVTIVERRPVAAVKAGPSGWLLVDATARVLDRSPTPPPDEPVLDGIGPPVAPGADLAPPAAGALAVAVQMPATLLPRVVAIVPVADGGVELRLKPSGVVRLGPPDQVAAKLLAVQTIVDHVDLHNLAVLDVRVPGSPVLTRR